ncbi:MAG: pilus assembly FimT family protein [Limisphaerales bacterium]
MGPAFPFRGRQKGQHAFTLIELMVVCMLVVILAAVIIPEMRGSYQGSLLRSTARKLMDAMDIAYSHAVSHDEVDRVRLDEQSGRYEVEGSVETQGQESFEALTDVQGAEGDLNDRISFKVRNTPEDSTNETAEAMSDGAATGNAGLSDQEADDAISFYPDGTADDREVILRDQEGFGLALRVNPITARVKIVELPRQ